MSTYSVARPRAGEVGEPRRKWIIIPRESPVPAAEPLPEALPIAEPVRVEPELEPERVD